MRKNPQSLRIRHSAMPRPIFLNICLAHLQSIVVTTVKFHRLILKTAEVVRATKFPLHYLNFVGLLLLYEECTLSSRAHNCALLDLTI